MCWWAILGLEPVTSSAVLLDTLDGVVISDAEQASPVV